MPFGMNVAGDVFQCKLDEIFGKLKNVMCIADDIMVVGYKDDHSDHDLALTKLLQTAKQNNVKLNFEKLQYKKHEVTFFGENYMTQGRKPDPKKIKAIVKMKQPEKKKEMQTFLGMVQYLQKFTPCLSVLAEPLQDLIKTNSPYIWGPEHTIVMNAIQEEMVKAPILKYFDLRQKTVPQTDASCKGLGACLLQDGHPIYFLNKSLTDAEKGYVAIELEALAVSWACEKFHHFLYGSHFTLQIDQKPLDSILAHSLNEATPRLQRLLIKASAYDFNIEYIPGQTNQVADCLSQLGCIKDNIVLPKLRVNAITQQLSNPDDVIQDIRLETAKDDKLSLLKHIVTTGWPEQIREVPKEIQPYWTFREELTVENGLLLKSTRIIIPKVMTDQFLNELHTGHLGITKCIELAKQTMYWPGINNDIEQFMVTCQPCLKYAASNKKCPEKKNQLGQEIPVMPWTKLGTDIFTLDRVNYLLVVDYTSKFPIM